MTLNKNSNQYIPYKASMGKTYFYLTNQDGKVLDKNTLLPYRGKQMNRYAFHSESEIDTIIAKFNSK